MDKQRRTFLSAGAAASAVAAVPAPAAAAPTSDVVSLARKSLDRLQRDGGKYAVITIVSDDECGPLVFAISLADKSFGAHGKMLARELKELSHWLTKGPCDDPGCHACDRRERVLSPAE